MEVSNWTSAGKTRADKIDFDTIVGYFGDIQNLQLGTVWIDGLNIGSNGGGYFMYDGNPVSWKHFTLLNGETIYYLG